MSDGVCVRCGRELTQVQRWNRKKYCSRDCFYDTRFGERVEWNGVWIRPGQTLEVLKLYRKGLSESEARKAVGADFKAMRRIRSTPELAAFLPKRLCLFCGKSLEQMSPRFKYCSNSCKKKAEYDRQNAAQGRITQRIDHVKRSRAIDLFARGLDGGSIARYLDVSPQEIKSWLYKYPIKRVPEICPELVPLLPLKHRLNQAESADEWRSILHDAAGGFGAPGHVVLVTGTLHGGGAPGRYASILLEKLKLNIAESASFAFCNVLRNAITVLEWKDGNWSLTRTLKTSGTFLWPKEDLGDFVAVTRAAFLHLLSYQKSAKNEEHSSEKP
jgi:predicted nucleic acid-binding Zn ribbon protein